MMEILSEIWKAIQSEFSDISSVTQATTLVLRLVSASILGGLIGYERELKGKSAGLRTHMLVALGSALFIITPQQAGASPEDISRILQGLVAGIGFLGAGAIMIGQQKENETGLTTAASVWITAAIGVTVGIGLETTAVISTLLTLLILASAPKITNKSSK
ncbi:MAG: MgtC/SapB family protein [Methylotenera sp.]|nr:MgtC/SapB family protein [Methylotenera sp.]MDP1755043.1 MgtC/SapB family protein [Methylotenera sp.]MDP1960158.1 MgtC/SapB family protein [Methylotenera sp.]MDP2102998.1 MgtC/SapB family protein [Methylotenera sp.]MDP2282304.1 MgtC/SapB family protein [Methylotenera sp.]